MRLASLTFALASIACLAFSAPACNAVRHPTAAGNCPRSPERVAKVDKLLVIGHRGAAGKEVENTIPSMQRAIADGANAVEIDLSMTKDGVVVLWHDWDPDASVAVTRQTSVEPNQHARPRVPSKGDDMRKPIDELTLAELREHYGYVVDGEKAAVEVPTLDQFMDWAVNERGLAYVFFDIKVPDERETLTEPLFQKVLAAVAARKPSWSHVFMTPNKRVYDRASAVVPDDALAFDADPGIVVVDSASCDDASSQRAVNRAKGGYASTVIPTGVGPEAWETLQKLLSCDLTARDRSSPPVPKKVFVATLNDRDQLECVLDMGLDGIITDDPASLRQIALDRGRTPFDPKAPVTNIARR
jgi:glycerophosphoryl diester phosphodiesterase